MTQYINKADVVAEIESKKKYAQTLGDNAINSSMQQFYDGMKQGCVDILFFLGTLEVKEVDLEKEFDNYTKDILACDVQFEPFTHLYNCAKHFFELGLKSKGE